jgi:hypothetical protein
MYFLKTIETQNEWWRYLVTLLIVIFVYLVLGGLPLLIVILMKGIHDPELDLEGFSDSYDPELLGLEQNTGLLILLVPAVLAFFSLLILMIRLHGQKPGNIVSFTGKIRWNRVGTGAALWLVLLIAGESIFYALDPGNYIFSFNVSKFIPLLAITLFVIPIQAWSEELLFRAYLMKGIGLLTGMRFAALILTSVLFGLLHVGNPEVQQFGFWSTMPYYVGFGLFAGLLVVFDGGIELACTVHAINNMYSAALVSYQSSVLTTSALWKIESLNPVLMNIGFLLMAVIFILVLARIFKWQIPGKLFQIGLEKP